MNWTALSQYFTSDCCLKNTKQIRIKQDQEFVYIVEPAIRKIIKKITIFEWKSVVDGQPEEEHEYELDLPKSVMYWCSVCNNMLTTGEKKGVSKKRFLKRLGWNIGKR